MLTSTTASTAQAQATKVPVPAVAITADAVLAHTKVLASDEFEGRAPGTKGEELSVDLHRRPVQEGRA